MDLKIYVESMKEGKSDFFSGTVPTESLLPKEPDLFFSDFLEISGEAYLAGDHLIIKLKAAVSAWVPCSICNTPTEIPLTLSDLYHAEPLEDITGAFDLSELLRENLLLELPRFTECQGLCPERENIKKYLKNPKASTPSHDAQFPFSNL